MPIYSMKKWNIVINLKTEDKMDYIENKVELNKDEKALAIKNAKDIMFLMSFTKELIEKGTLSKDSVKTNMSLLESYTVEAHRLLNYESETAAKYDKRHKEIRECNTKIYNLEKELANKAFEKTNFKDLRDYTEKVEDLLKAFWTLKGFGHIREVSFSKVFIVEFSMMFSRYRSSFSDTPVTDKKKRKLWKDEIAENWDIIKRGDTEDWRLKLTERNTEKLKKLFEEYLGSSIREFETRGFQDEFFITSAKVFIRDPQKLELLEEKLKKEFKVESLDGYREF